jgi:hypothetical protein
MMIAMQMKRWFYSFSALCLVLIISGFITQITNDKISFVRNFSYQNILLFMPLNAIYMPDTIFWDIEAASHFICITAYGWDDYWPHSQRNKVEDEAGLNCSKPHSHVTENRSYFF